MVPLEQGTLGELSPECNLAWIGGEGCERNNVQAERDEGGKTQALAPVPGRYTGVCERCVQWQASTFDEAAFSPLTNALASLVDT
jgi:hypothetical protein